MPEIPTFEELLASPHLQFDLNDELLPHLLAFGPGSTRPSRPWLFDAVTETTVGVPIEDKSITEKENPTDV